MFPWWPCATKTVPSASTSSAGSDSSSAGGSVSSSDDGSTRGNGFHPAAPPAAQMDPVLLRSEMVDRQLLKRGIRDERVVAAMLSVPRHEFVPVGTAEEQRLLRVEKRDNVLLKRPLYHCRFVPLIGQYGWKPKDS